MATPFQVDRSLYPFESRWFDAPEGRMHYLDEGSGPPLVLVHGTPTWSFLFRSLIGPLSRTHRVIAVDHLGFGLSDKPEGAGYRPADHARRLARLLESLELEPFTLLVHDFGGPIGLSYAVEHPERVERLILLNTWMWSLAGDRSAERASRIMGGPIGRFLYRRLNFSPRVLIPALFADRSRLPAAVHRHFTGVFPTAHDRMAPWTLARELIGSGDWYDALWTRRERLADKPALLVWGMADPAFGPAVLRRWEEALPGAEVVRLEGVGHFATEEAPERVLEEVRGFLAGGAADREASA